MTAQRVLFFIVASLIGVGIWLSGYQSVHWILYVPAVMLAFAAITGICPGLTILRKLGFK